ncbi:hypothetical protein GCM10023346_17010 [Arthrobacter gyeryongensis]|uniref:SGNH hydrolase-type esterase domain-containing protein n=1 Tax=Arthrobacter gyeryongensis TaxID=1650592 RepID=A0ABP9SCH5_9MICC
MSSVVLAGCTQAPPPVSGKVQQACDNIGKATLPAAVNGTTVAFIGDSYTPGTGAGNPANRWTTKLSVDMSWSEVNLGKGGTGYFNAGSSVNYRGVIPDAVSSKPAIVLVAGGGNDLGFGVQRFGPSVDAFYAALRKALPDAKIVAVSPYFRD